MCTVTYIPTSDNSFIFTTNRDEFKQRSATVLIKETNGSSKEILFPQDPKANGTWIAISDYNQLVCILNGAFVKHKHRPPYRISRGVMAKEFFSYRTAELFFDQFNFEGIEPFTMIIFDNGRLYELRWDGNNKHIKEMDTTDAHIWASATLYPKEWQEKRLLWFSEFLESNAVINRNEILDFHKNTGEGNPEYDLVMNRSDVVCTTSITSIVSDSGAMDMRFESLLDQKIEYGRLAPAPLPT